MKIIIFHKVKKNSTPFAFEVDNLKIVDTSYGILTVSKYFIHGRQSGLSFKIKIKVT